MTAIFTGLGAGFERGSGSVLGSAGLLGSAVQGRSGEQLLLNAATGNFMVSQRDEFLVGLGLDAAVSRTYNSLGDQSDDNGDNWRQGYDRRIVNLTGTPNAAGSTVQRVSGDGSVITYNWDVAKSAYVATDGGGAYDRLTQSGNVWTWTDGDSQVKETYQAHTSPTKGSYWRLISQADTDNNIVSFSYTGDNIAQVTTAGVGSGISTLTYTWAGNNLTQVVTGYVDDFTNPSAPTSKTLTRTRYTYDANRLASVTVDLSPDDSSIADGKTYTTNYTYKSDTVGDAGFKLVASISQSDGSQIDITYTTDGTYRVASLIQTASTGVTRTTSVAYGSGFTAITDPSGEVIGLSYDAAGRLTSLSNYNNRLYNPQLSSTIGWAVDADPNGIAGPISTGTANGKNFISTNLTATAANQVASLGTDATHWVDVAAGETLLIQAGIETSGVIGNAQLVVHFIDANGNYLTGPHIGSLSGNQSFNTKISGHITVPAGAAKARFEVYAHTTGGGTGTLKIIDPVVASAGQTTRFAYNASGDVTSVTDALGNVTSYTYDDPVNPDATDNGLAHRITDRLGNVVTRTYGAKNELLTETTTSSDATSSAAAHIVRYVYDGENHLRYRISAEGQVAEYRYTAAGLQSSVISYTEGTYTAGSISLTEMDNWAASLAWSSTIQRTDYVYDARGGLVKQLSYSDLNINRLQYSPINSTAGWVLGYNPNNIAVAGSPYTGSWNGKNYIRADVNATGAGQTISIATAFDASFDVAGGERLAIRTGIESQGSIGSLQLTIHYWDASGNYVGSSSVASIAGTHPYDTQLTGFADVPANAARARFELYAHTTTAGAGSAILINPMVTQAAADQTQVPVYSSGIAGYTGPVTGGSLASYSQTGFVYDQAGRLLARTTQGRSTEAFIYDGLGRMVSAVDVNGGTTSYVFEDSATKTIVTFANGLRQVSTYNKAGELISFVEQAVTPTNLGEAVGEARYDYDRNGRLRRQIDATGRKTYFLYDQLGRKVANVSSQGDVIEYRYDSDNRLIATIAHGARYVGSLTALDNPDAVINPATYIPASNTSDLWSWIVYDKEGRVLQMIAGDGSTSVNTYDGVGRLVSTTNYYNQLTNAQLITIKATLPTAVTLSTLGPDIAKDRVARNFYDKDGRLLGVLDGEGFLTRIVYDKAGQKVQETRFFNATSAVLRATGTFNQLVASITASSVNDRTINYSYDGQGQLRYVIDSLGYVTHTDYDSAGRATTVIQYAATLPTTTDFTYDNVKALVASGNLAASVGTRTNWIVYDGAGRAAYTIDAEGAVVANSYNAAGELTKSTQFNTIRSTPSLPSKATMDSWAAANASATADRVTRFYYDGVGELRYTVDAENFVTRVDLDAEGRVTDSRRWANKVSVSESTTIDSLHSLVVGSGGTESRTITTYDSLGRIEKVTDAEGFITFREYGANGLVWRETHAWGTTDTRVSTFYYDGAGRIAFTRSAEDYVTEASYNAFGEVNKLTRRHNKATGTAVSGTAPTVAADATRDAATYTYYDRRGLAVAARDAEDYVIETTYDAFGQVTSFTRRYNKASGAAIVDVLPTVTANAAKDATSYNYYDKRGLLTVSRDSENYLTVTTYTAFGQVDTVNRRYNRTTSPVSLITVPTVTAHANDATTDIDYDRLGRVIKVTDAESQIEQYTLNAFGDIVKLVDKLGNSTFSYFDKRGLRVATRDAEDYVTHTSYNALGQIDTITRRYSKATGTAVIGIPPTVAANATRDAVTSHNYDKRGLLIEVRDAEDHVTRTSYTAHGQVDKVTRFYNKATGTRVSGTLATVAVNAKDAVTDIDYDRLGRVTKSTDAELKFERFEYDAFGNRVKWFNKINAELNYGYDRRGLLTSETLPMVAMRADGTTQATSVTNKFEYDARGNRTKMIEAHGLTEQRTTIYDYDKLDRLASKTLDAVSALSQSDHRTTSTVTPTESYVYDAGGNLKQVTDALGGLTVSFYDRIGRKTDEVGPLGTMTHWTFDAAGNMLAARIYGGAVAVPAATATTPPSPPANYRETGYTYDKLGRLKTTTVANVLVGVWNGSTGVAPTTQAVTTSQDFDAFNNVIKTIDANLYATFSYYDRLGRKTTQVDPLNFATKWEYDGEGNATKETRYANALGSAPTITTEPVAPTTSTDDRITNFTYDKNGRRLTEARTGVIAWSVNATNGVLTQLSTTQTIIYTYNALGQVATKQEATGDSVTYSYDGTGRLLTETRAAIVDYTGATVSPMVQYAYNGLNDLAFTRQGKSVQAAGDRFTRYTYGAAGRLASMTDAAGGIHNYAYDAAGNLLRDSYVRLKSDGNSVNEGILYTRDLLGRITAQAIATDNGTSWIRGDSQNSEYNAYGNISRRGINGLWQESFAYDNIGRVSATNSGDGVWRFFVYDANGNQTLAIESEGSNLDNLTVDQALALARPGGVAAGSAFVDGINIAITVYDKRNMAIESHLPQRELSSGGARAEILTKQTYNAFGEVKSQTDALANKTDLTYNTMGRLTKKELPTVNWTSESGVVASARPTEQYYYDRSGRLVASLDANGNRTSRTLLAGSGYGGAEAQVTAEIHADGGIAQTFYNHFGDARILRNELSQDEWRDYDAMGRLVYQSHRGGLLTDNYTYDLLGQRIAHWNSFLGAYNVETTDYDLQGRVVRQVTFGGDAVTTTYEWQGSMATSGMGTFGGWAQTDTYANGRTMIVSTDMFGRDVWKRDLGGHEFSWAYDQAGRQTARYSAAGETLTISWLNSGLAASLSLGAGDYQNFTYDAAGNRLSEYLVRGYVVAQNATATYDALNRLVTWNEVGSPQTPPASKQIEYDLNGNIRRNNSIYRTFNDDGLISGYNTTQDLWFRYDSMNRVVFSDGQLSGGAIVHVNGRSSAIQYDVAGQRVTVDRQQSMTATVYVDDGGGGGGGGGGGWDPYPPTHEQGALVPEATTSGYVTTSYSGLQREAFAYNLDGTLSEVGSATQGYVDNGDGTASAGAMPAGTNITAGFTYDAMGRLTRQLDYMTNGTVGTDRNVTLNTKGQMTYEVTVRKQWDGDSYDTYRDENTYSYGIGTAYALGAVTRIDTQGYKVGVSGSDDAAVPDPRTVNTYAWYDGAVLSQVGYTTNINDSSPTTYYSTFTSSASGVLTQVVINDNRRRKVTYTTDMSGQVIIRDEDKWTLSGYIANGPKEVWHRFGGREMQFTSNNSASTAPMDYQASAAKRWAKPSSTTTGMFANGAATTGYAYGDADSSFEGVTSSRQGSASGRYTVRGGETLQSIAQAVWGDSGYWYKIAEANGLSADSMLAEGQALTLPAGVTRSSNNASTFKPYDASEAMGDTSPTRIKPPKPKKSGLFGKILLAVLVIAVTAVLTAGIAAVASGATFASSFSAVMGGSMVGLGATAATATAAATAGLSAAAAIAIGAAGAAVGSIVGQGIGIATGLQDKFSWKSVGIAALAGGIGAGIGPGGALGKGGLFGANVGGKLVPGAFGSVSSAVVRAGLNGAVASALTQGVSVATGLQPKFDWAGVAAAGIGAGIGAAVGGKLGGLSTGLRRGITGGASLIANASTRSLIDGSDFGDNVLAGLPDVIAQTIGGFIEDGISMPKPEFDPKVTGQYRDALAGMNEDGSFNYGLDAVTVFDELISTRAFEPEVAFEIADDSILVSEIMNLRAMDGPGGAVNSIDGDNTINYLDGSESTSIFYKDSPGADLLASVNRLSGRIDQFKEDVHFNEIILGVQVLLGPASAAKAIAVGLVGDAVIGDYVERGANAIASAIGASSLGMSYESFDETLNWGDDYFQSLMPEDRPLARGLTLDYQGIHGGAKAILGIIGSVVLGVGLTGGRRPNNDEMRYDAHWADLASKPGTLSDVNTRAWYKYEISKLPGLLRGSNLSLEKQARFAHNFRNEVRTKGRTLMADRGGAADLDVSDPNRTWKQMVARTQAKGFSGDALFREIISSAGRSRASIDKQMGFYD